MEQLRTYPAGVRPGEIESTAELECLVSHSRPDLHGDDGGMAGDKLFARMETVVWEPPTLRFAIERHGGTVMGSTRAELQHWAVDVDQKMATLEKVGHRQLYPMARRIYVGPIVEEIATMIINHQEDGRLRWDGDDRVWVVTGRIFPRNSAFKRTLDYRRRRFRAALKERLAQEGWVESGRNIYNQKKGQVR
jgi:hypothetical protein